MTVPSLNYPELLEINKEGEVTGKLRFVGRYADKKDAFFQAKYHANFGAKEAFVQYINGMYHVFVKRG